MVTESVFQDPAIVFLAFWAPTARERPARCCAAATGSTPKAAASVTVAGRAPSATCRRRSASIPSAGAAASASWAHAPATLGTKEKTVKKRIAWTQPVPAMVCASTASATATRAGGAATVKS